MYTRLPMTDELKKVFEKYNTGYTDFIGFEVGDVNQRGAGEDCLIHVAARNGTLDDVRILVVNGADINKPGELSMTALHYAAMRGHSKVVEFLLSKGASNTARDDFGQTALKVALNGSHHDVIELLK